MTNERIQYDGYELDEIVAEGVTVHLELMDAHHWMIRIYRPERIVDFLRQDGIDIHLSGNDLFEVSPSVGLPVIRRPAITWCEVWTDRRGIEHKCYRRPHKAPSRHRCSCGATRMCGGLHD